MKPPEFLDGAKVLEWAWSGSEPFGYMNDTDGIPVYAVYGQAICQYQNHNKFYRFTCDQDWNVVNDFDNDSIEEAKESAAQLYRVPATAWNKA
jgi:hypothetical protein